MDISHEQLAQLLVGIAKAHSAIAMLQPAAQIGLVSVPALQESSGVNARRDPTLTDLPQRLLMHILTGNEHNALTTAMRELPRLLPDR